MNAREIHHVPLPPAAEIEALVSEYKDAIERRLADPLRTRIPAAERLYQLLIAPVRPWIPAGSRVILATDGALHGLNLEASAAAAVAAWQRTAILDRRCDAGHRAFARTACGANAPRASGARRLLLLGDPVASDSSFPPLAYAAGEMETVTRRFGGRDQVVLARDAATAEAYRAAGPGRFSAIHFTAHAVANRESPLDSAVLLSGGKLYAREVMDVPLTADLVTISACRGVGLRTYSGEGLVGFAWAFLRAGARHVDRRPVGRERSIHRRTDGRALSRTGRREAARRRAARRQALADCVARQFAQALLLGALPTLHRDAVGQASRPVPRSAYRVVTA